MTRRELLRRLLWAPLVAPAALVAARAVRYPAELFAWASRPQWWTKEFDYGAVRRWSRAIWADATKPTYLSVSRFMGRRAGDAIQITRVRRLSCPESPLIPK